ncbi:MAG: site-specific integrase [Mycoplasma sp.]|nr:site-specific integrase [Mycoplasma sp.]
MNKFINFLIKNNYSENTIITYKNILKKYEKDWIDIRNIRKRILNYKESPNTAWTHYNVLLSFMKFKKDKRIDTLKSIKLPPIPEVYMPIFTKSFLISRTKDLTIYKNVVIRFLFETGLRASELKKIISINNKTLIVKGKGSKIREIFHNIETTKLFNNFNYTEKTLRLWVKEVLGKKYTPHSIRRSHATHMLLKGANPKTVMLQLGHSKVETTYRYLKLSKTNNLKIYNKFY